MEYLSKVYLASVGRLDAHWEEKEIMLKLKWGFYFFFSNPAGII